MPMHITTLGRERTIATLASKIYKIEGPRRKEMQLLAEAALLRANPRLATAEGFSHGSTVLVPNIRGLQLSDVVAVSRAEASGLTDETSLRLKAGAVGIEESFQRFEKNTQAKLDQLGDKKFRAEIKRISPEAERLITQFHVQLKKEQAENKEKRASLQAAISNAIENTEILQKLAARARTN